MSSDNRDRTEFIKEMYGVYWANITRSMDGVWKVLGPVTVVGTIMAGIHREYLPALSGVALAFLIIFWALNVVIDLNDWHLRNLFFLTKAEHEFLNLDDYGKLLPSAYRIPKNEWITFYKINATVFLALLVLTLLFALFKVNPRELVILAIGLTVGAVSTVWNYKHQEKRAAKKHKELFGNAKQEGP